jgi:hypothetical protein
MKLTTAGEIQNYIKAGLVLCGQDEDGELEWIGDDEAWKRLTWLEDGVPEEYIHRNAIDTI